MRWRSESVGLVAVRPLHVDREEDWSDWVQHFIATSTTGIFSWLLFNRSDLPGPEPCIGASVLREDVIDDRRADLVIAWGNATRTHVEIKVGDRAFAKTAETASKLEQKYPAPRWSHYCHHRPRWVPPPPRSPGPRGPGREVALPHVASRYFAAGGKSEGPGLAT